MKILFLGVKPESPNLSLVLGPTLSSAQCLFLEHFRASASCPEESFRDGFRITNVYWDNYSDAVQLLKKVNPERIVFLLLDNYYHIALYFAARSLSIDIYFLDHGIRFEHEIDIMQRLDRLQLSLPQRVIRRSRMKFWFVMRKHRFVQKTLSQLPDSLRSRATAVIRSRSNNFFGDFMRESGRFISPDKIIAYSPETFSFYKRFFQLPSSWDKVVYTGIPYLLSISSALLKSRNSSCHQEERQGVLFIDQPLHENSIAGWSAERKYYFLARLARLIKDKGLRLYIKPHPGNDPYYEQVPGLQETGAVIVNEISHDIIANLAFAGSFNSTLLLPLCADPCVACFCIEMHPAQVKPEISYGITKYGVAVAIKSFPELSTFLDNREAELYKKLERIPNYIDKVLYSIDDQAGERISASIIS